MASKSEEYDTLIDLKFFLRGYFFVKRFQPLPQLLSTMMNEQDLSDVEVLSSLIYFLNITVLLVILEILIFRVTYGLRKVLLSRTFKACSSSFW